MLIALSIALLTHKQIRGMVTNEAMQGIFLLQAKLTTYEVAQNSGDEDSGERARKTWATQEQLLLLSQKGNKQAGTTIFHRASWQQT